jgi:hypothetical protein
MPTEVLFDRDIYERLILGEVPLASSFLWIATADIKDMHIKQGPRMVPFLQVLSGLVDDGVSVRIIHAKEPGPAFRKDFDRYPNLIDGMEMILCPRTHFKTVIEHRRNFESGILSDDPAVIEPLMDQFDRLWMGERCPPCQRKAHCATYHELIG